MPESTEQMSPTLNRQTSSVETLPVLKPAPIVASELLPVPSSNIPAILVLPTLLVPKNSRVPYAEPTAAADACHSAGYRVVVEAASVQQALVRSLVPGAFRTFRKVGVDAGLYRAKAEQIRQMLNSKGLSYNPAVELIVATATNTGVLGTGTCSARKSIHPATVRTAPIARNPRSQANSRSAPVLHDEYRI